MKIRRYSLSIGTIAIVILVAITTGLGSGAFAASEWADNQNTTGQLTVTSGSADLYICEPAGSSGDPNCPGDDSGADEIIFEGDEDMVPGSNRHWTIRLVNIGELEWDVHEVAFAISEVADPDADCDTLPRRSFPTDAPPGFPELSVIPDDDDHLATGSGQFTPPFRFLPGSTGAHVAPGEFEDVFIAVTMPNDLPIACKGNVWSMSLTFIVEPHQ